MKIINLSKAIAALVAIFLTLAVFTYTSASLLQENKSLWISRCGIGSRKMAMDCTSREATPEHDISFESLKKKQSPPPPPVVKKKKQLKTTSLFFRTPPRF
ncbi:hypothetical protein DCAR_0727666 [Daucus carota subsp. sativus]|uniref:Uncharacterized protein n=1 Tax=Daucus carota subsp. sativus TaxID=79200 RepID=A0A164TBJ3_DAUCS|nr:PREDICTED: uncharacterized protein LOC108195789 [Daucus carota subsp. sativus]WOH08229.1 hypothetical protein DCAR_0727666 [Daucus carota subsp. sativus]